MRLGILVTIFRKEMLDLLRDRRTLISMILLPLVAIPGVLTATGKFMSMSERKSEAEANTVGVPLAGVSDELAATLKRAGVQVLPKADLRKAVEEKSVAAAVAEAGAAGSLELLIYVDRTRQASNMAGDKLRAAFADLKDEKVKLSLRNSGVSDKLLTPFTVKRVNVASERKMGGFVWGSMLGYVVLLIMFSGGMYPAIDMTAGEKERRTLEALLSSPAARMEIALAKILAAMSATYMTALLTLASLVYSLRSGAFVTPRMREAMGQMPLDPQSLGLIVFTLLPVAMMAGSIMIAIALLARGFKEAQSYLTPLVMLVIFPALLGGLPGMELNPKLALIPIFNASQLIRGIMLGEVSTSGMAITFAANLVYAGVAFAVAVRTFKSESVLFRT